MVSRREFIKKTTLASTLLGMPTILNSQILKANSSSNLIIGHGDFTYKVDKNWAKINVSKTPLLNCHEMQMDSKGRLLMIGDHTKNNILVFDKSGKLLDSWGTRFPGGHGLTLQNEGGEDVLYIVDCGSYKDKDGKNKNQSGVVYKTKIDGQLIFTFPDPRTIGAYTQEMIYRPTETCVAPNGDVYIADGYGSNFILHFNSKGEYLGKFGGINNSDKNYNLEQAHGIAIDYRTKNNPVLIVTSRKECCFKFFTLDGIFIKKVDLPGAMICRPVLDDDQIYAGVCWTKIGDERPKRNSGFVTILDKENNVVSNPGGTKPTYINGILQPMAQAENAIFNHGHDVLIDEDKNLYICQWNANATPPIKLERI